MPPSALWALDGYIHSVSQLSQSLCPPPREHPSRHAYGMVMVSSYALSISPQQLAGCLWLLRCSYECLSGATALPHCPLPNTLTSHPWLRLVPAAFTRLSTLKNLGGHSSFSTSSGPTSCQVFLSWPPASFAALQPILSPLAEFEPRYGFQGLHSGLCCILSPPPPPASTLDLPRVLSLLPWSGSAIGTLLEHVGIISDHRGEQPLPAIDGRSLLVTASSRWAEPETATVPRGKGFSIWKCSTRNCRAGPSRAVAPALFLIPPSGFCTRNSYVFEFQPRPARCL